MRIVLTKSEIATRAGVELLSLCSNITEDGSVSNDEIQQLRDWLAQNQSEPMPAIAYLSTLVNRIVADGRITPNERKELHRALERVLPKDHREIAIQRREALEIEEWKHRPVQRSDFLVAGVRYEGRAKIVKQHACSGDPVALVRDKNNGHSGNAIRVVLKTGQCVGHVPEEYAVEMAPFLDLGYQQKAWIKTLWRGHRALYPVIIAEIYAPDRVVDGARVVTEVKSGELTNNAVSQPAGFGCLGVTAIAFLIVLIATPFLAIAISRAGRFFVQN
jgi:hypothetical protein